MCVWGWGGVYKCFLRVCVCLYVNWRIKKKIMFHPSASRFMPQNFYPKPLPREGVLPFAPSAT